jgi:hypothetical protein
MKQTFLKIKLITNNILLLTKEGGAMNYNNIKVHLNNNYKHRMRMKLI